MRLLPREEKFFDYFKRQASLVVQAAQLLHSSVKKGNSTLKVAAEEIGRLEKQGDEIVLEIFRRLNQTFITPMDPEDIHALGSSLDDVLDVTEEAAHRIVAYKIEPIPVEVENLCRLLEGCAKALDRAVNAMIENKPMLEHCMEINRLEDETDNVTRTAVANLFDHEKDPIRVIKLKEIYEFLELAADHAENVSDRLQNVAVKNA